MHREARRELDQLRTDTASFVKELENRQVNDQAQEIRDLRAEVANLRRNLQHKEEQLNQQQEQKPKDQAQKQALLQVDPSDIYAYCYKRGFLDQTWDQSTKELKLLILPSPRKSHFKTMKSVKP